MASQVVQVSVSIMRLLVRLVGWLAGFRSRFGHDVMMMYGNDESYDENLLEQSRCLDPVQGGT